MSQLLNQTLSSSWERQPSEDVLSFVNLLPAELGKNKNKNQNALSKFIFLRILIC